MASAPGKGSDFLRTKDWLGVRLQEGPGAQVSAGTEDPSGIRGQFQFSSLWEPGPIPPSPVLRQSPELGRSGGICLHSPQQPEA